jgi:hypothetical protein
LERIDHSPKQNRHFLERSFQVSYILHLVLERPYYLGITAPLARRSTRSLFRLLVLPLWVGRQNTKLSMCCSCRWASNRVHLPHIEWDIRWCIYYVRYLSISTLLAPRRYKHSNLLFCSCRTVNYHGYGFYFAVCLRRYFWLLNPVQITFDERNHWFFRQMLW